MNSELSQNHFALFGLPVGFEVDADLLAERYRELQRTVHPDRYANASERDRRLSMQRAAQINEAFRALKQPLARARYLLELYGLALDDERDTHLDPAFLMEQMELRERLSEVRDAAEPLAALDVLMREIGARVREITGSLAAMFGGGQPEDLRRAKQEVQKLQFLEKLRHEAEAVEEDLADAI